MSSYGVMEYLGVNSLPHTRILDNTQLKAFTDNNLNVAPMVELVFERVENIVEKGENIGYHKS